ncbi:MAG TPA: hydrogenase maturation nickel metallochaperone HypA [Caldisericia bacterium]|nr:hydrogenase maturation nickel metallochaperone HypA [Caldisericia bacterium]HPF48915.1 hydrogenase maturation nickel metallochaperone HypA [Caldisericia bacterium]HPI83221.1 hydrogenase maturation nickel metallochaperone HypA [Caldisericia bacterium]HPQ92448.1 hydrogenase maturation nickel metallochaperone HypA [Caldisericia bacterium]HRV74454.1 hydrogenase maturation nickel metallochaperone HypA [Caldisericia bacterium]
MHELGIANQILELLKSEAEKRDARVTGVTLTIGKMSGIMPDSLVFLLETISKGTACEGMKIDFSLEETRLECKSCSHSFVTSDFDFRCPKCKSGDCVIISGKDLVIDKIGLEVPDGA